MLANTSYRFRTKAVRIAEDGSKSVSSYRGVAGPTGRLASSRFTDPGETNRTIWDGAGPGLFVRKSGHDGTRYVRAARGSLVAGMYDTYIRDVYSLMVYALSRDFHWEPVDRFTRGGQVFVVFETTGVNRSGDETTGFTAGNMTMTVREDGLVTSIRGAGKRADDGGSRRYRIRFEVTDVGTATTSRPDWVDSRIPNVSARLIMNGSVVKVTHHGGPTIRKAMLRLELGYRDELVSQVGNVTSGETVYVYRNADGLLVVERTRPSPAETSGTFESASSVTVKLVGEDVSVGVVAYWTERA